MNYTPPENDEDAAEDELELEVVDHPDEDLEVVHEVDEADERQPEHWMEDEEVERLNVPYSIRPSGSWVISGPLGDFVDSRGGRRFETWCDAEDWARAKYGDKFIQRHGPVANSGMQRWAFLIRRLA